MPGIIASTHCLIFICVQVGDQHPLHDQTAMKLFFDLQPRRHTQNLCSTPIPNQMLISGTFGFVIDEGPMMEALDDDGQKKIKH